MQSRAIILDTDIGDDVDDALALAVALNSPELEVRGVTTVFRDATRRAQLAENLLKVWQREEIPVFAGCSKPLLQPFDPKLGNQCEVLPEEQEYSLRQEHAVDYLVRVALESDEEITLVPIGPLTNIAVTLARFPELATRVEIVMMGGAWNPHSEYFRAEWNIACDPEAAAMIFNSGARISMIGLDVTRRCVLSHSDVSRIGQHDSPRARVLSQLIDLWMRESSRPPTLHDPLAVLTLFSDCVQLEEKQIEVQLCGEQRGKMKVRDGQPNACVAVDVDVERAIELFMERVLL